jgi:hypothetical protein
MYKVRSGGRQKKMVAQNRCIEIIYFDNDIIPIELKPIGSYSDEGGLLDIGLKGMNSVFICHR